MISELQSRWVAKIISNKLTLPPPIEMKKTIQDDIKDKLLVSVKKADGTKCARCWKIVKNINENKCSRTKICPLQNVGK